MFDLIRKTEGDVSREEFSKAVIFLFLLTAGSALVLILFEKVNSNMVWMTTAVAPFLGLLTAFVVFSILYFWANLFLKRFRTLGKPAYFIYSWLALFFVDSIIRLVVYQITTLTFSKLEYLFIGSTLIAIMQIAFYVLFIIIIFTGMLKQNVEES